MFFQYSRKKRALLTQALLYTHKRIRKCLVDNFFTFAWSTINKIWKTMKFFFKCIKGSFSKPDTLERGRKKIPYWTQWFRRFKMAIIVRTFPDDPVKPSGTFPKWLIFQSAEDDNHYWGCAHADLRHLCPNLNSPKINFFTNAVFLSRSNSNLRYLTEG